MITQQTYASLALTVYQSSAPNTLGQTVLLVGVATTLASVFAANWV